MSKYRNIEEIIEAKIAQTALQGKESADNAQCNEEVCECGYRKCIVRYSDGSKSTCGDCGKKIKEEAE